MENLRDSRTLANYFWRRTKGKSEQYRNMVDYSRFDNIHDSDDENDDQHERSREANKILTGSF